MKTFRIILQILALLVFVILLFQSVGGIYIFQLGSDAVVNQQGIPALLASLVFVAVASLFAGIALFLKRTSIGMLAAGVVVIAGVALSFVSLQISDDYHALASMNFPLGIFAVIGGALLFGVHKIALR